MHVSILGTGAIGSAFAEAFLKAGHNVTVYNRSAGKIAHLLALGARHCDSAGEAIAQADATVVALSDGAALKSVMDAIAAPSLSGAKILNASTTRVSEIEEIARQLSIKGAALAEVSVNVGPDQIREGAGMYLLGSCEADAGLWTDLLRSIGGTVHLAGRLGDASRAELPLLISYLFGLTASAHIAAIVSRTAMPEDILATYVYPALPAAEHAVPQMIARQFADATASVDAFGGLAENAVKDFAAMGYPTQTLDAILALFRKASGGGFGAKDGTAVVEGLYLDDLRAWGL